MVTWQGYVLTPYGERWLDTDDQEAWNNAVYESGETARQLLEAHIIDKCAFILEDDGYGGVRISVKTIGFRAKAQVHQWNKLFDSRNPSPTAKSVRIQETILRKAVRWWLTIFPKMQDNLLMQWYLGNEEADSKACLLCDDIKECEGWKLCGACYSNPRVWKDAQRFFWDSFLFSY